MRLLTIEPRRHVHDLPRAVAFYRDVLGFQVTTLFPEAAPVFAMLRREFAVRDPDGNLFVFSQETTDPPTARG